jgi:hypothetical protein
MQSTVVHIDTSPEGQLKAMENFLFGTTGLGFMCGINWVIGEVDKAIGDRYEGDKQAFFTQVRPGGDNNPLTLDGHHKYLYVRTMRKSTEDRRDEQAAQAIAAAIGDYLQKLETMLLTS